MTRTSFTLRPTPPFRLDLTVWALRRAPANDIDAWDGEAYRRILLVGDMPVAVDVRSAGSLHDPKLLVKVCGEQVSEHAQGVITSSLAKTLGLNKNLTGFYELAERDIHLKTLAERFLGLKPPRFPSIFEAAINGIICQQISLPACIRILSRLAKTYGPSIENTRRFALPRPEDLANLQPENLKTLGLSSSKARAIGDLSCLIAGGGLDIEGLDQAEDEEIRTLLQSIRGIGRWTAEYVLLRGFGRLHVFPGDDIGARNRLKTWLSMEETPDYQQVRRILTRWEPYSGLIYFHLLLNRLGQKGCLDAGKAASEGTYH